MADFEKAGLLTIRDGRILLCRKKHSTSLLILPGGVIEPGETLEECLRREIDEEVQCVTLGSLTFLATYESPAAIPGKTVRIHLFQGEVTGSPTPASEIKELIWFHPDDDRAQLAPSLRDIIFPDLEKRGIWPQPKP